MFNLTTSALVQPTDPLVSIEFLQFLSAVLLSMPYPRAVIFYENSTKHILNEILSNTPSYILWFTSNIDSNGKYNYMIGHLRQLNPLDFIIVAYNDSNNLIEKHSHRTKDLTLWDTDSSCYLVLDIAHHHQSNIDVAYFLKLKRSDIFCVAILKQFNSNLQLLFLDNNDLLVDLSDLDQSVSSMYDRVFGWHFNNFMGKQIKFITDLSVPSFVIGRRKISGDRYEYGAGGSSVYLAQMIGRFLNASIYFQHENASDIVSSKNDFYYFLINEVKKTRDVDAVLPLGLDSRYMSI